MDINTRLNMMNMLGKFSSQVMQLAHQRLAEAGKDTSGCGSKGLSKEKSSKKSTEMRKKGNDLFKKKKHDESDHRRILHFYNCSIAHATPNSEELALAYSNRSVLWLHTKKFDLCLTDIGRAQNITQSDDLKTKLLARKQNCLQLKQVTPSPKASKHLELPEISRSKVVPCAANSVTLKYDEKNGRHFVANRDIKPGEIVMIEETPYMSVKSDQVYLICSHCFAFVWAGIPCDSCVFAMYCNETCKKASWIQYHDIMCPKLFSLHCMSFDPRFFNSKDLAARVMDIAIKREGLDAVLKDATDMDQKRVMNLETLLSEDRVDCKKFRSLYNLKSFEKSNGAGPATSESVLDKLLFIVQNNSFRFQTSAPTGSVRAFQCECESFESCISSDCPNRGSILGTCSSLFNHSCDPNTVRMFLPGPKIVLFTTRPVKKGEQLCVCYGPTADCMDKKMRQEDLEARYSFTCECKPCKENWPADPNSLTADPAKRYLLQSHIARTFGGQGEMFHRPPHTWTYNVKNLKGAIKISEFVYQNFDARNAYWLNNSFGLYILGCFHKLYGENVDFPNLCQP